MDKREEGWYWVKHGDEWAPYLFEQGFWCRAQYCEIEDDELFHESFQVGPRIEPPEGLE